MRVPGLNLKMTSRHDLLSDQYTMVLDSRKVLLDFCSSISAAHFTSVSEQVGNGGSIKNLMIHTCNSYFGWLSHFALKNTFNKIAYDSISELSECRAYYDRVNLLVQEFLSRFTEDYEELIAGTIGSSQQTATALTLFTHVITHEYHHKGQMLTLARMWGYIPVDTDMLR